MSEFRPVKHRQTPWLRTTGLSESEREGVTRLCISLANLDSEIKKFHSALCLYQAASGSFETTRAELFAFRRNQDPFETPESRTKYESLNLDYEIAWEWPTLIQRVAALIIYDIGWVKKGLHEALNKSPIILNVIDKEKLREARNLFEKTFPDHIDARDAASHLAERTQRPQKWEEHALREDKEGIVNASPEAFASNKVVVDSRKGDRMTYTWEGGQKSVEISEDALGALYKVRDLYFAAFSAAEPLLHRLETEEYERQAKRAESGEPPPSDETPS